MLKQPILTWIHSLDLLNNKNGIRKIYETYFKNHSSTNQLDSLFCTGLIRSFEENLTNEATKTILGFFKKYMNFNDMMRVEDFYKSVNIDIYWLGLKKIF